MSIKDSHGGTVNNPAGQTITGATYGVDIYGGQGSVTNSGDIYGENGGVGVIISAGGTVTNNVGGKIKGSDGVYAVSGYGTVENSGYISGSGVGIRLLAGGYLDNSKSATVLGTNGGIFVEGAAGKIENAGTLEGTNVYGVYLDAGGTVTNTASATISGGGYGVVGNGAYVKVLNSGYLKGGTELAIFLKEAGYVGNTSGATIAGYRGIRFDGAGTVTNAGTIKAKATYGIVLAGGGTVTNQTGATISGPIGIRSSGDDNVKVYNSGYIHGVDGDGVVLSSSGYIDNSGGASIVGYTAISFSGVAEVKNAGTITTNSDSAVAIFLGVGGTVANESGGTISSIGGAAIAAYAKQGGSGAYVTNAGMISGGSYSVYFNGTGAHSLTLQTGSTLNGTAQGSSASGATNALKLQGTGEADNAFTNFDTLDVAATGDWTLGGDSTIGATTVTTGTLIVTGSLTSALTLAGDGAAAEFMSSFDGNVTFEGSDALSLSQAYGGEIDGFGTGDSIDLTNLKFEGATQVSSVAEVGNTDVYDVTVAEGSDSFALAFESSTPLTVAKFALSADANDDTAVKAICYLRGTRILTPTGEAEIESLRVGDGVVTRFGGIQPIKWIGRQSFAARFVARNLDRVPVRIHAGALRAKSPARDLFVSPGHSMLVDGRLALAKLIVNGVTITQAPPTDDVHYYQIELEGHDCVIAEGAWSETFADGPGLREQCHNAAEFWRLYPDHAPAEALNLCAPRPERGPELEAMLRPIAARAAVTVTPGALRGSIDAVIDARRIEGWAQDVAHPEMPVDLEIWLGDERIGSALACERRWDLAEAGVGRGHQAFYFTSSTPLAIERLSALRVRRAADGAEVPMSANCRALVAGEDAPRRTGLAA